MTVGELMAKLREFDPRLTVVVWASAFSTGSLEATSVESSKDFKFNEDHDETSVSDVVIIQ